MCNQLAYSLAETRALIKISRTAIYAELKAGVSRR